MRVTILRLPLTYGPRAKANIAALARALRRGIPLPLAAIENRRSVLGVGNLASALLALLASEGDAQRATTYFVADANAVSTTALVEAMARAMRVRGAAVRLADGRASHRRRMVGPQRDRRAPARHAGGGHRRRSAPAFAWSPPYSLDEGMAQAFGPGAPL